MSQPPTGPAPFSAPNAAPLAAGFTGVMPPDPTTPVVVSVPHAGLAVAGFESALSPALDVRCDADLHVDKLYEGLPAGAWAFARFSRFVCDLNRHPDDVSPQAVPEHPAPRNRDGRGFVWFVTTTGAPAQARALGLAEWQARKAIHDAYYGFLADALRRARERFGYAILVDGHSMPSVGKAGHTDTGRARADVVPGDREGAACAPALSALVVAHFQGHGYRVARNDPYKGGFITQHHGRPADGVHAIQIELRRDNYMDEVTYAIKPEGFARLRGAIGDLLRKLDGFDPRA